MTYRQRAYSGAYLTRKSMHFGVFLERFRLLLIAIID